MGLSALLLAVLAAGCTEEVPTGVGSSLTDGALRTFEIVLDPAVFLQSDTTFGGLSGSGNVAFRLVAESFEGELDGHTLLKHTAPTAVTYTDSTDNQTTDSIPQFVGARLLVEVDTSASTAPAGSTLELYTITEDWDASATWALRVDTGSVQVPWTQPGGTVGSLVGSVAYDPDIPDDQLVDTLSIAIDSASAVLLADTLAPVHGVLLKGGTAGTRFRLRSARLLFQVRPLARQDTVLEITAQQTSAYVYNPAVAPSPGDSVVRVGGFPGWRSVYRFRALQDLELDLGPDCGRTVCTVPITDVTMNYAALVLEPSFAGGFRTELPVYLEARGVLETPGVPLVRSPLSLSRRGQMTDSVAAARFSATPADTDPVEVPITTFIRRLVNPDVAESDRESVMALLPYFEGNAFGYAQFTSANSADPPRLRLVVSVVNPEGIQ